jgi:hypothetical protein
MDDKGNSCKRKWDMASQVDNIVFCFGFCSPLFFVSALHEVGEEAGMGGGGQQICIAEVTYVVWRRVVPLSDSRSGVRWFSDWQRQLG